LAVLQTHRDQLEAVAQRLLEVETLEREEFEDLMVRASMTDLALDEDEERDASQTPEDAV